MDYSKLTENSGLKIGSLAVALLLWFHIATEKATYERVLEVPILVEGVSSELVISAEIPAVARVRFQGRGKRLLTLPWRDVQVVIDASDILTRGTRPRRLSMGNVRYPESPDLSVVDIVEPEQITIETDRLVTRHLPVMVRMEIQIESGYTLVGSVSVEPDSVTLLGPALGLRDISYVDTDTLRLRRRISSPIDQEIPVRIPPIYGLRVEPPLVRIMQDVQALGIRTFAEVPVHFEGTDNPDRYLAQPRTASVTVSGGVRLLENLTENDIRLIIDLSRQRPDGMTPLIPRLELPQGISQVSLDPEYFRVTEY